MTQRYIYTDKVGAGPEHPNKRWGLFSTELTADEAAQRYALDAVRRDAWFGVVLLEPGEERPSAYLQVSPRGNGVTLHKLNPHGSIDASYTWGAYYQPQDDAPYTGDEDRLFLDAITWYVYPEGERFFSRSESLGSVSMQFRPDGYAKEDRTTRRGFGEPSEVETREFRDVDVTANWLPIPEFGEWDDYFHPEADEDSSVA
ncbi:hypothetical protein [Microbacterium sp.]|uniref:hypothetical protein n=1 Tax=Microbacterium sp. TaxID=51671 RepID=UPI0028126959|nr:hypothetical protein [Microbacterium sp.]